MCGGVLVGQLCLAVSIGASSLGVADIIKIGRAAVGCHFAAACSVNHGAVATCCSLNVKVKLRQCDRDHPAAWGVELEGQSVSGTTTLLCTAVMQLRPTRRPQGRQARSPVLQQPPVDGDMWTASLVLPSVGLPFCCYDSVCQSLRRQ